MKLIDNINDAWRFASVRLAVIAGIIVAWTTTYPEQYEALVSQLPEQWRPLIGVVVAIIAVGSRVVTTGKPSEPPA